MCNRPRKLDLTLPSACCSASNSWFDDQWVEMGQTPRRDPHCQRLRCPISSHCRLRQKHDPSVSDHTISFFKRVHLTHAPVLWPLLKINSTLTDSACCISLALAMTWPWPQSKNLPYCSGTGIPKTHLKQVETKFLRWKVRPSNICWMNVFLIQSRWQHGPSQNKSGNVQKVTLPKNTWMLLCYPAGRRKPTLDQQTTLNCIAANCRLYSLCYEYLYHSSTPETKVDFSHRVGAQDNRVKSVQKLKIPRAVSLRDIAIQ